MINKSSKVLGAHECARRTQKHLMKTLKWMYDTYSMIQTVRNGQEYKIIQKLDEIDVMISKIQKESLKIRSRLT